VAGQTARGVALSVIRKTWLLAAPALALLMISAACDGGSPAVVGNITPLCRPVGQADRFRYTLKYTLDSPQPTGEVDESAVGEPPFALTPKAPDFRFEQDMNGEVENPDRIRLVSSTPETGELELITIGDEQWAHLGGQWKSNGRQASPFPPVATCDAILKGLDLDGAESSADTIDGKEVLRYELKGAELETAVVIFTAKSDMGRLLKTYDVTVWLAKKDRSPVRIDSVSVGSYPSGRQLTMNISLSFKDINAGDINVEPPV
jgi:hypothetical protein